MLHLTGVLGVAAFTAMWSLAIVLFAAGPGRLVNRRLALLLLMVGIDIGTGGPGLLSMDWIQARPDVAHGILALHFTVDSTLPPLYLLFLAAAFRSPVTRFLARRTVTILLKTAALTGPAVVLWQMDALTAGAPATTALFAYVAAGFLLAFSIALHAFLQATRRSHRGILGAYLIAFGTLDITWGSTFIGAALLLDAEGPPGILFDHFGAIVYPGGAMVFGALLAYAVLRHQLLGIDLKIKWTINKSTLVAVFIGAFFVSAQVAQAFLTTEYGWAIGGVVAGLLLLVINPLQRFAAHVADTAMPNVQDTQEYRTIRKCEVYQAALEEILTDGRITAKERRTLIRLQEQLGLDASTAQTIEVGVLDSTGGA